MKERMRYAPHPEDPQNKTLMTSEMVVTVRNVPLTTYMESIILSTVSSNANKGRKAMEWVVNKFENETKSLTEYLDKLKLEVLDLKNLASDSVIAHAQLSIDDLQKKLTVAAEEASKNAARTRIWKWNNLSTQFAITFLRLLKNMLKISTKFYIQMKTPGLC